MFETLEMINLLRNKIKLLEDESNVFTRKIFELANASGNTELLFLLVEHLENIKIVNQKYKELIELLQISLLEERNESIRHSDRQ